MSPSDASPSDPERPVVETPKHGPPPPEANEQAIRLRIRQQEILAELGVMALRAPPLEELLNAAVHLSAEGLQAEFCKILEYIPAENRLLMRAGVGWHQGLVGSASVGADLASPSGFALRTGRPVISNHLQSEKRFRTPELLAAHGVRRAINVILQGDGSPFGVLEVDSRSEGEFSEHDIAFLQGAANVLGMAIERQRREQALQAALEYQKVLVKEINHRVKNSLQLAASVLNLQAGDDPEVSRRLHEASSRIMAIGRAHDRLYRSPQVESIELAGYLSDICSDLKELTPHCDVFFAASQPILLGTDRAIGLALVMTELVGNAAKHAYPNGEYGQIWVNLSRIDGDAARLSVRDAGVGLPAELDNAKRGGLGMRLVRALAKQTGAQFRVERHANGTEFVVEIPLSTNDASTAASLS